MIRKDFIQRHLDELANVIAVVLQLKNNLKPVEAEAKINDFANDFLGLSFDELINVNGSLVDYLIAKHKFTLTHFKVLEDLLYHKHLFNTTDNHLNEITLEVLNYVAKNDTSYSFERVNRINQIK